VWQVPRQEVGWAGGRRKAWESGHEARSIGGSQEFHSVTSRNNRGDCNSRNRSEGKKYRTSMQPPPNMGHGFEAAKKISYSLRPYIQGHGFEVTEIIDCNLRPYIQGHGFEATEERGVWCSHSTQEHTTKNMDK
jgi:hypothetical protein